MAMKREVVRCAWESEESQEGFAALVPFPDVQASAKDVDVIEDFVGLNPPLDVLDVGCGIGRHAIEFARRGYRVVGIDIAQGFLAQAKEAAQDASVAVEFRFQPASALTEKAHFDFVLAYWHVIGFMKDDEIKRHFSAIQTALKPGCSFLYVFQGPRLLPSRKGETAQPVRSWTEKDGKFILTEKSIRDGVRDEYCIVIDTEAAEIVEYREHQRALGYEDVLGYLRGAGFESVKGYKDFAKTPATPEEFSIFVCQK
jgi:SAM-dependent methyltransferase